MTAKVKHYLSHNVETGALRVGESVLSIEATKPIKGSDGWKWRKVGNKRWNVANWTALKQMAADETGLPIEAGSKPIRPTKPTNQATKGTKPMTSKSTTTGPTTDAPALDRWAEFTADEQAAITASVDAAIAGADERALDPRDKAIAELSAQVATLAKALAELSK